MTMQLDRTKEPDRQAIASLSYTKPEVHCLRNGVQVYAIDAAEQDLLRIELIFNAGEWYQDKPLQASACVQMLNEGSEKYTSEHIAEKLDFYGSFVLLNTQKHTSTVSLFCLGQYLNESLEILTDMLFAPRFPEKEFKTVMDQKFQHFKIESDKVEWQAARNFMQLLFGKDHPYSTKPSEEDFSALSIDDLKDFHQAHYGSCNCKMIVAGKVTKDHLARIEQHLGMHKWGCSQIPPNPTFETKASTDRRRYTEKDGAVQSAIRIGLPMVNKKHPDYKRLQVLNTVLGGYFGSRLMANIREDKGYTYGIHSSMASLQENGYFIINSQVGKDVRQAAIDEVYKEIQRLCEEPVPAEELEITKNYMLGQILRYFDGPFNMADTLKSLLDYDLDYDYYTEVVEEINNISSEELLQLAKQYFGNKEFYEVSVG